MRAVVQDRYGPPDAVLRLANRPVPEVGDREVLVRVHATSVHADVWHAVGGRPILVRLDGGGFLRPRNPVPGTDLAGTVEAIGERVTRFGVGDPVFGESSLEMAWRNGGTWAELAAVPEGALARKPDRVGFAEAAAVPSAAHIALLNLRGSAAVEPGDSVLINGAGGAVGSIALQIASDRGATVTAVDRADKLEMLIGLGADRVLDYERKDPTGDETRYDLILDVASTLRLRDCRRVLRKGGTYLVIGHDHYGRRGGRVLGTLPRFFWTVLRGLWDPHLPKMGKAGPPPTVGEMMETLRSMLDAGRLTPVIGRTFPLEDAREAMRCLVEGEVVGRIVLTPGADPDAEEA